MSEHPIVQKGISHRLYNSLIGEGFETYEQVAPLGEAKFMTIPKFGLGQLAELKRVMAGYGLELAPKERHEGGVLKHLVKTRRLLLEQLKSLDLAIEQAQKVGVTREN